MTYILPQDGGEQVKPSSYENLWSSVHFNLCVHILMLQAIQRLDQETQSKVKVNDSQKFPLSVL